MDPITVATEVALNIFAITGLDGLRISDMLYGALTCGAILP